MINVKKNGSFDILLAGISLFDCFPGVDGRAIRPLSVMVQNVDFGFSIKYSLDFGEIWLIIKEDENLVIETNCIGFSTSPYSVNPIQSAVIEAIDGIFIQRMGLRGEYGYFDINNTKFKTSKVESVGITSLKSNSGSLTISAFTHDQMTNIYSIEPSFQENYSVLFSAGFNLERTRSGDFSLPSINFISSEKMQDGLSYAANETAIAMKARPQNHQTRIWSSWYYRFNYMTYDVLKEYLEGFGKSSAKESLFDYIQIDAGYATAPGDWLSVNTQWPGGLKIAFDLIKSYGYKPGIWIAPFVVGNNSKLYIEHPDYVLFDLSGKPVIEKKFYEWNKPWPNFDTEYYILDTSNPGAMEYIIGIFKSLKEQGALLFKTDFMLWGMVDSTKVKRYCEGKTSVEYFRELIVNIRNAIGEESYLLGCIAPFLPFVSVADGMRIAGDVVSSYETSHVKMLASKFIGANYFNHIYWENDPDVFIIRDFDTNLKPFEARAMAIFQAFTGGITGTSDPLFKSSEKLIEFFKFLTPQKIVKPYYPFFEENRDEIVACISENKKHIVMVFNPGDTKIMRKYTLKRLLDIEKAYIIEIQSQKPSMDLTEEFYTEIDGHDCALYYIDENERIVESPNNLWGRI